MEQLKQYLSANTFSLPLLVAGFTILMLFMVFSLGNNTGDHALGESIHHFEDLNNSHTILSIDEIAAQEWKRNDSQNFGLTPAAQWLKVNLGRVSRTKLLEIDYAMLDSVKLWFRVKDDSIQAGYRIIQSYEVGDSLLFAARPIIHDKFLIPLPDAPNGLQILLRVQSNGPVKSPLKIWSKKEYISYTASHRLFMGLFFGYMLAMGLINLFLFITTRSSTFIFYAAYVISFALLIATLHGLGYRFIWPQSPWLQERTTAIFAFSMMSFVLIFSSRILNLKSSNATYFEVFRIFSFIYIAGIICSFILPYSLMIKLLLILLLFSIPIILFVSLSLAFKGSEVAKYFAAAWLILLLSGLAAAADNFHWLNLPIDSSYLLMVGATTETLLLALALAKSYNENKLETRRAHKDSERSELEAMKAQTEVLELQKQAQLDLEAQVLARTQEFDGALGDLSLVNKELKAISEIDPLTGINNRRFFEKQIVTEALRSRRERQALAIAILDIDHFKQVNDTYGHPSGDDCLVAFAKCLKTFVKRPGDIISRLGGEEFVVMLPNTTIDNGMAILEKFRVAIENMTVNTHGHQIQFTVSAGLSSRVISNIEKEPNALLARADKLLYQAKQAGRNCIKSGVF